jgi:hypothetical protein
MVGAQTETWQLGEIFEDERHGFDVDTLITDAIRKAFPPLDALVRVTHRGCSCDLLSVGPPRPSLPTERSRLRARREQALRNAVVEAATRFGDVRLLVHGRNAEHSAGSRKVMALEEFIRNGPVFALGVLFEIRGKQDRR